MDAVFFRDLRAEALIGIHKRERHILQTLSIDLDIGLPGTTVFASDKVAAPIDYEQVRARAEGQLRKSQRNYLTLLGSPDTIIEKVKTMLSVLRPGTFIFFGPQGISFVNQSYDLGLSKKARIAGPSSSPT